MRVVIVDDHEMFAASLARLLEDADDIVSITVCTTVADLPRAFATHTPDVVLADWNLADGNGGDVIRAVKPRDGAPPGPRAGAPPKVVVLTGANDPDVISAAVTAGCDGFVTKDRAPQELLSALRAAHRGEVQLTPAALAAMRPDPAARGRGATASDLGLSGREVEIVELLALAHSNAEIAEALFISPNTVRNHLSRISGKLGVSTRLEIVAEAVRAGVVTMER